MCVVLSISVASGDAAVSIAQLLCSASGMQACWLGTLLWTSMILFNRVWHAAVSGLAQRLQVQGTVRKNVKDVRTAPAGGKRRSQAQARLQRTHSVHQVPRPACPACADNVLHSDMSCSDAPRAGSADMRTVSAVLHGCECSS